VTTSPYYTDAVKLLAALHSTTAEIIHQNCRDTDTEIGLQLSRELQIVILYTEAVAGRKCECGKKQC
jgi:hypothetical protein